MAKKSKLNKQRKHKRKDSIQRAIDYGIDVTLLYESSELTPTERLENNRHWMEAAEELRRAGQKKNAQS